jgi:hypothetical protein
MATRGCTSRTARSDPQGRRVSCARPRQPWRSAAAGLSEPGDRVVDGVNQLGWLTGQAATEQREGYIYWMGPQMYGVKWRNFKLVLVAQKYMQDLAASCPPAG